jgi:hypothetical protein
MVESCFFSPRFFFCGLAVGWLVMRFALSSDVHSTTAVSIRPAATRVPELLVASAGVPVPPPTPETAPSPPPGPAGGLHAECVDRSTGAPTVPDDIVLAIMTTEKRHGLIQMLRETWLKDAKALFLTDAPGLPEAPKQRVRVWRGHPDCGAADRGGPTIALANESFWGDYKWIIHVDDDVATQLAPTLWSLARVC